MRKGNLISMIIFAALSLASAQQLRVDSVMVDTVWSSDSTWYNNQGFQQQRNSRDLYLSFKPMPSGGGMAKCFVAITIDSGKVWIPSYDSLPLWDSLIALDSGLSSLVQCGTAGRVKLRVLGKDRLGVAFRIMAQQWQPIIAGNPDFVVQGGILTTLTAGASCSVNLQCSLKNVSQGLGFAPIAKVWWDAFGTAGTWSDSTSAMSYTWNTTVPTGAAGQKRAMIAKARDANGLWSAPCTLTVQFGLKKPLTMVSIPAGTFQMGSANTILAATPVHSVTIGAFTISQTLVTQEQYQAVMGVNPSYFDSGSTWPVEYMNWYDAARFCNKLSMLEGLDTVYTYTGIYQGSGSDTLTSVAIDYTKNGYRLPTEAEYEYANRAGTTTDYYWGRNYPPTTHADTLAIDSNAVWFNNSFNSTQPVATKKPNAWELYDMSGNLWEWCNDWFGDYNATSQTNPTGAISGSHRVLRGGSWSDDGDYAADRLCAASRNGGYSPVSANAFDGFRVVCGAR